MQFRMATLNLETANLDYQTRDMVALVARILVDDAPLDVYVTHLYMSRGDDSLRLFQVQQLLAWIDTRDDVPARIVCGDFNASLDMPSATLMATPLSSNPDGTNRLHAAREPRRFRVPSLWPRIDRCIDYIWTSGAIEVVSSGVCFNRASPDDPSLWPSDHAGVWADLSTAS
jgi:endonuclease/exonuclease/phosphatase family metal-dependent hydrolase